MQEIVEFENSKLAGPALKICVDGLYSTGGKSKQITQRELNTIVGFLVTHFLYTHKIRPTLPLLPVNDHYRLGDLGGIVYF